MLFGLFGSVLLVASGCGGNDKPVSEPSPLPVQPQSDSWQRTEAEDEPIEAEIIESIQRTFARKQTVVARCFVAGVEAGEVPKTARGFVTVGATITPAGRARRAQILKASLKSKALHRCIIELVETWEFAEPPRDLETSFTYSLEQL